MPFKALSVETLCMYYIHGNIIINGQGNTVQLTNTDLPHMHEFYHNIQILSQFKLILFYRMVLQVISN